jgi:hypothetical protein
MNYDYDIFISFSQSDNSDVDIEWSMKFCNILDDLLNKMNNEKPVIITSADIEARINMFHITRKEIYSRAAVFLVIMSPDALKDKAFLDEIDGFAQFLEFHTDGNLEKSNRIFKIMGSPIPFNDMPMKLRYETSYNFYEKNLMNGRTSLFDLSYDSKKDSIFWSRLVDLAYDVALSINHLKLPPVEQHNQETVYLATTTTDQEDYRDIIKRDLKQRGIKVVPEFDLPDEPGFFKKIVLELIEKSDLSIHVIGGYYGTYLSDFPYSALEYQNKIVTEYLQENNDSEGLERLIWISSDLNVVEPKQRLYIGRLKRDSTFKNSEEIECPLEDLKSIIDDKLEKSIKRKARGENKLLFFQYPNSSDQKVVELKELLAGMKVEIVTSEQIEQEDILDVYWNKLKDADVLLYYYNGNKFWLDFKMKDTLKSKVYRDSGKALKVVVVDENGSVPRYPNIENLTVVGMGEVHAKLNELLA